MKADSIANNNPPSSYRDDSGAEPQNVNILVDAADIPYSENISIIIAGPGAGKSSLMRTIAGTTAEHWLNDKPQPFVPIRITATALLAETTFQGALAAGVVHEAGATLADSSLSEIFSFPPIFGVSWLVMVDGVDEILDRSLRMRALQIIRFHRDSGLYKFLIASRPLPADELDLLDADGFQQYSLEPLEEEMLPVLAARWFAALGLSDQAGLTQRFRFRIRNYHLRLLARNPLIATMICLVFADNWETALPATRGDLYSRFVQVLFAKQVAPLNVRSSLKIRVNAYGPTVESAVDFLLNRLRTLLEKVAFERQSGSTTSILALALDYVRDLKPDEIADDPWKDMVHEMLRQSGLLVDRGNDVSFIHQTIEEYLTACRVAADCQPDMRQSDDLLKATGIWNKFTVEVRLFVLAAWVRQGHDLSDTYRRMITQSKTGKDADFIASLLLDGIQFPDDCLDGAIELLVNLLEPSVDSRDGLTAETVLMLADMIQVRNAIRTASDSESTYKKRSEAVAMLPRMNIHGYHAEILKLSHESEYPEIRIAAASALNLSGFAEGRRVLVALSGNTKLSDDLRMAAAQALTYTKSPIALDLLAQLARDASRSPLTRITSAIIACSMDKDASLGLLLELSSQLMTVDDAKFALAHALHSRGHPKGLEIYRNAITDSALDPFVRIEAVAWLRGLVSEQPELMDVVHNGYLLIACDVGVPVELRATLCRRLEKLSEDLAEMAYRRMALDSTVPDVRRLEAARTLLRLRSPNSVSILRSLARDSSLKPELRERISEVMSRSVSE